MSGQFDLRLQGTKTILQGSKITNIYTYSFTDADL